MKVVVAVIAKTLLGLAVIAGFVAILWTTSSGIGFLVGAVGLRELFGLALMIIGLALVYAGYELGNQIIKDYKEWRERREFSKWQGR